MATQMPRIKNYNVSIKELDNKIIFLRKLVPGGSEHSFGIHVAKMAGMPNFIIKRGNEILHQLEKQRSDEPSAKGLHKKKSKAQSSEFQLNMFSIDDPILIKIRDSIKDLNVNELTPVEALMKLDDIQRLLKS
jgi:DNA mismatch repair protein MutS